jgi:tetratricopeptide (TPR) repeat protein
LKALLLCGLATFIWLGCVSSEQKAFDNGKMAAEKGSFEEAISSFDKVIIRSPESDLGIAATREAARISFFETKNFLLAAYYNQKLVLYSKDAVERQVAQKGIVGIYFDQLGDYQRAVLEINKLVMMLEDPVEVSEYKIKLARAYYYQNNFVQAENEVLEFLKTYPESDQRFDMTLLLANINLAKKQLADAAAVFQKILKEFPERATKENVGLMLSVCYEEMKDFKSASEVLLSIRAKHPMPEYVDLRIERLKARMKNQPGARGRIRK